MTTPVAMLIFNRPELTARVFGAVRAARPPVLLIVADGPRAGRPGEDARCAEARRVVTAVDWPCEVITDFASENMGCRRRVSSGITWVFERVERAIILEDDCVPHPSFFGFCDALLDRYSDDRRVSLISGDNFLGPRGNERTSHPYYFSRYAHVWGWATWRRAWAGYDVDMRRWPDVRDGGWLADLLGAGGAEAAYWTKAFERTYRGEIDTWDYQWQFAVWLQGGLSVIPRRNMVSNIGFGPDATHTLTPSAVAELPVHEAATPDDKLPLVVRDARADRRVFETHFRPPPLPARAARRLWRLLGRR